MIENVFVFYANLAVEALCKEAELAPKPGLVDAFDNGSHKDMDVQLLKKSAHAFEAGFVKYLWAGYNHSGSPKELLAKIRIIGMEIEENMFVETGGINTHKGANFSFGVFLTALGFLLKTNSWGEEEKLSPRDFEDLIAYIKKMTRDLVNDDFSKTAKKSEGELSYGERLYLKHGFTGIRGEAAAGYPSIAGLALPKYFALSKTKRSEEAVFIELLFWLMTLTQDSNLIARGGMEALIYAKSVAEDFLVAGGTSQGDYKEKILLLNAAFVKKNISPGGSADLLALTIFLSKIVKED